MLPTKRTSLMAKVTDPAFKRARTEVARGPIIACVRFWGSAFYVFEGRDHTQTHTLNLTHMRTCM